MLVSGGEVWHKSVIIIVVRSLFDGGHEQAGVFNDDPCKSSARLSGVGLILRRSIQGGCHSQKIHLDLESCVYGHDELSARQNGWHFH